MIPPIPVVLLDVPTWKGGMRSIAICDEPEGVRLRDARGVELLGGLAALEDFRPRAEELLRQARALQAERERPPRTAGHPAEART